MQHEIIYDVIIYDVLNSCNTKLYMMS